MLSTYSKMSIRSRILFLKLGQRRFTCRNSLSSIIFSPYLFRRLFEWGSILNRLRNWYLLHVRLVCVLLLLDIKRFELDQKFLVRVIIAKNLLLIFIVISVLSFLKHILILILIQFFLLIFKVYVWVVITFKVDILENTTVYVLNYIGINLLRKLLFTTVILAAD